MHGFPGQKMHFEPETLDDMLVSRAAEDRIEDSILAACCEQ